MHPKLVGQTTLFFSPPAWNWNSPSRKSYYIWILFRGRGGFQLNGRRYGLKPGFGILLAPEDHVYAWSESKEPITNLALHLHFPRQEELIQTVCAHPFWVRRLPFFWELAAYMDHDHGPLDREADKAELNQLAVQFLQAIFRDAESGPEDPLDTLILSQVTVLRQEPASFESVSRLAREVSLSEPQYNRRFKALVGLPPGSFVIQERMRQARRLLSESSLPVEQIAEALQYRDLPYFSRHFKRIHGVCPREYRKRGRIRL